MNKLARYGPWQCIEKLGQGGQATVERVIHTESGQIGALKVIKDKRRIGRLRNELEALTRISSDKIVRVLGSDLDCKLPYIVLEYIDGWPLNKIRVSLDKIDISVRIFWFNQLCIAIGAAHDQNVYHRDIKPANIIVGKDGDIRVCDFGLAYVDEDNRLTASHEQVGSRFYMPPECANGRVENVGPESDIYSLGKVLYYLLSVGEMFDRERHRYPSYDLVLLLADPYMEVFNRILDVMIVEDLEERAGNVYGIWEAVMEASEAYEGQYPIANVPSTFKCIFCRVGTYERYAYQDPLSGTHMTNGGGTVTGQIPFEYLVCHHCGNCQQFAIYENRPNWIKAK